MTPAADAVSPKQRVEPVAEQPPVAGQPHDQSGDRYAEQIGSAVKLLGAPKPELLWILLLVVVIEGAQLWESDRRVATSQALIGNIITHLEVTEAHRSDEQRRAQETIQSLSQSLTRQVERGVSSVFSGQVREAK